MRMFVTGAIGYPVLELLYRQRTHWSMAVAGGLSCMLIGRTARLRTRRSVRAIMCGLGVTGIEYICGRIVNRSFRVWDYRRQPLNLHGQVCAAYTALWCGLSYAMLSVLDRMQKHA